MPGGLNTELNTLAHPAEELGLVATGKQAVASERDED